MKYIVMECHPAYAVLLDSEGRFVKACNKNYETGQYVSDPVLIKDDDNMLDNVMRIDRRRKITKYSIVAACIVFLLCFNVFRLFLVDHTSLYIIINPEIRIDMNRIGQVISVEAENSDGAALLAECNTDSKDKLTVCRNIIKTAYDTGYIGAGGKICVYIDSPDDENFREIGTRLSEGLASFTEGEYSADIEILSISQYVFDSDGEEITETEITQPEITENETLVAESTTHRSGTHQGHNDFDDDDDDYDDDDDDDDD